ncbi:methyltransferase domain-containing protein [Micromonospora sp. STR1s_5]|nr:methyltransferase domain-containing protein [Micromonospora sp. STR1s_5]
MPIQTGQLCLRSQATSRWTAARRWSDTPALLSDRAEVQQHGLDTPLAFAADASFDGVVCALLHHLTSRARFIGEIRRVLRPGG